MANREFNRAIFIFIFESSDIMTASAISMIDISNRRYVWLVLQVLKGPCAFRSHAHTYTYYLWTGCRKKTTICNIFIWHFTKEKFRLDSQIYWLFSRQRLRIHLGKLHNPVFHVHNLIGTGPDNQAVFHFGFWFGVLLWPIKYDKQINKNIGLFLTECGVELSEIVPQYSGLVHKQLWWIIITM